MPNGSKGISVELKTMFPQGKIFYTTNGDEPTMSSKPYEGKIVLEQSAAIKAALFDRNEKRGETFSQIFNINKATGKSITLKNQPHVEYSRGGAMALVDGATGGLPWLPSDWLGFQAVDFDATIDLESPQTISRVTVDVLKDEEGKIFLPSKVTVLTSIDGTNFKEAASIDSSAINEFQRKLRISFAASDARYVQVIAKNATSHWLFVDEVMVE